VSRIAGVLDQIERRPAIRQHATKLAVQIGALAGQSGYGLRDSRVFVCPIVAAPGQDLHTASIEPGVHPVAVKLDFMKPVGPVRSLFDERRELRFDPDGQRGSLNRSSVVTRPPLGRANPDQDWVRLRAGDAAPPPAREHAAVAGAAVRRTTR